jgi:subfamily B ATP-binding cassette protein MsbA
VSRFRRILPFLVPYRTAFSLGFIAVTIASVLDGFSFALLIPFFRVLFGGEAAPSESVTWIERVVSNTVGASFEGVDQQDVLIVAVVLVFLSTMMKNVFVYLGALQNVRIQEGIARDLRVALFSHILSMRPRFLENRKSGDLLSRMLADAAVAKEFITQALASVLRNGILILVYLVVLFSLSWRLTLVTLVLAPALAGVLGPITRRLRANLKKALEDLGELSALTSEVVGGARVVKAFGAEEFEKTRFRAAAEKCVQRIVSAQRYAILASPLSETMGAGIIVMLLVAAGWLATQGTPVRPELFVTFLAVTLRLLSPVKSLSQVPAQAEISLTAAQRIFEILDVPSDDSDVPGARPFPGLNTCLEFKGVSFEYNAGEPVLTDVSMKVRAGSVVGIVGPSGAGKSTLVDILSRFLEPTGGEILVDGVEVSSYSTSSWRKHFGVVSQETIIFNDSVLTNIAYGEATPDRARAEAAARTANAHLFIERLPEGYDTHLGERGTKLSGGERQRLAIARAIYRDPPLLILDEATSSLDTESERLIQEAFERLFKDRTVLVIAHRLSTIVRADAIVVLDGGRIVEVGKHAELVNSGGLYQQLYSTGEGKGLI